MFKNILFSGLFLLGVVLYSCDDSFLDQGSDKIYQLTDTIFLTNGQADVSIPLEIPLVNNAHYSIIKFPNWMNFDSYEGQFSNGVTYLKFSINNNNSGIFDFGIYTGEVNIEIKEHGIISIPIVFWNVGNPVINVSTQDIDFGLEYESNLQISNVSEGILFWQIEQLPDWLTVTRASGMLDSHNTTSVILNVNRQNLKSGNYSGTFIIENNSKGNPIDISVKMDVAEDSPPEGLQTIEGDVTDVEYNRDKDLMLICLKNPNRIIVYNCADNSSETINLERPPACISFSPDGEKAVVGYYLQANISRINIEKLEIENTIQISFIPFDIVYGENEWCYVTPVEDQWVNFQSFNIDTEEAVLSNSSIYERTHIYKLPNMNYLIGTSISLSPSGVDLFKINGDDILNDTVKQIHEDAGYIWPSEDGKRIFCKTGKVYKTPDFYTASSYNIPAIAILNTSYEVSITWINHNTNTNNLFVAKSYEYDMNKKSVIEVLNATTYMNDMSIPVENMRIDDKTYLSDVQYMFSNKDGTKLYTIRNVRENYYIGDNWSFNVINLQ